MSHARRFAWFATVLIPSAWSLLGGGAEAGIIRGVVLGTDGMPSAGSEVWAARLAVSSPLEVRETLTDEEGRFEVSVGTGHWSVYARDGSLGGRVSYSETPEIEADTDEASVTIRLLEWGSLRGEIREEESGRPVAGAKLALDNGIVLTTDVQGQFAFEGLEPGSHEAYVVHQSLRRQRILFDTTLRPEAELELAIPIGKTIVGVVIDEQGQPIPEARVGLNTSGTILSGAALWESVDDAGRFVWHGMTPDRPGRLTAMAPGFASHEVDGILASDRSPLDVDFQLNREADEGPEEPIADAEGAADAEKTRTITGVVRDEAGEPVADAVVAWGFGHQAKSEARSGADGRFTLETVPAEAWMVSATASQSRGLAPGFVSVDKDQAGPIDVTLETGATVRGRVVDEDGEPLAGIWISPSIANPQPGWAGFAYLVNRRGDTDDTGRFTIEGLPKGGVRFDFVGEGFSAIRQRELALGDSDDREAFNTVEMNGEGLIRGRVVDSDGAPVRNFRILLDAPRQRDPGDPIGGFFAGFSGVGLSFTTDDGTFVISDLTAEHIQRVTAVAEGHSAAIEDRVFAHTMRRLPPAESLTLVVGPPTPFRLLAVSGADGEPIADARVTLVNGDPALDDFFVWGYNDVSWAETSRRRTGMDGWAEFPSLPFGEATVLVQRPGFARRRLGWRNGEQEITATLEPEAAVSGVIRDADGTPINEVSISLLGPSGDQYQTSVAGQDRGHFQIDQLPAGAYHLSISRSFGPRLYQDQLELKPGQVEVLSLQLDGSSPEAQPNVVNRPMEGPGIGDLAPDFSIETVDGTTLRLGDQRGKFVLLDFWAVWCAPCRAETPYLKDVFETFGANDRFAMIGLSLDDDPEKPQAYAEEHEIGWTQGFLGDWSDDEVTKSYGVSGIPSIWLIGPDGTILARNLRGVGIASAINQAMDDAE